MLPSALSTYELDSEQAELLPARDTLTIVQFNIATNVAVAVSAGNINIGAGGNAGNVAAIAASIQANIRH